MSSYFLLQSHGPHNVHAIKCKGLCTFNKISSNLSPMEVNKIEMNKSNQVMMSGQRNKQIYIRYVIELKSKSKLTEDTTMLFA